MSSADYWYVYIAVVALLLVGSRWCHAQRRRYLVRQQLQSSSQPTFAAAQPQQQQRGVVQLQMVDLAGSPHSPAGYTTVWVDGRLVYRPLYSPAHIDPPPPYQAYPPGVAAVPVPYSDSFSPAVAALPVDHYAAKPSYRLSDVEGAGPVPLHLRPVDVAAASPAAGTAVDATAASSEAAVRHGGEMSQGETEQAGPRQGEADVTVDVK